MKDVRESGFELLRILAMLGVMALHAGFYGDVPAVSESEGWLVPWFRCIMHAFEVVSVNVFVLISGYFGIRTRVRGVLNFAWQIVFWRVVAVLMLAVFWSASPSTMTSYVPWMGLDVESIGFSFGGWFVGAYLGLMLIAPVLNAYAESCETKRLGLYVLLFLAVEVVCDWLLPSLNFFKGGYTPFAFIGLYLGGRYLKRNDAVDVSCRVAGLLFLAVAISAGTAMAIAVVFGGSMPILRNRLMYAAYGYTSPTTLACSFLSIMYFKHVRFTSRIVNWLAASAFGTYLFHGSLPFFKRSAVWIYQNHSGVLAVVVTIGLIVGTYVLSVLVDQIRRAVWDAGEKV